MIVPCDTPSVYITCYLEEMKNSTGKRIVYGYSGKRGNPSGSVPIRFLPLTSASFLELGSLKNIEGKATTGG